MQNLPPPSGNRRARDVATQQRNVARHVREDASFGRLYLPLAWEREVGLESDEWLQNLLFDARTVSGTNRPIKVVDVLHQRSEQDFPAAARLV